MGVQDEAGGCVDMNEVWYRMGIWRTVFNTKLKVLGLIDGLVSQLFILSGWSHVNQYDAQHSFFHSN